ncbi:hypothetical protein KFL_002010100 [Klebsormidium nitens]|uniref:Uncharacterized protein n=1 Tax=Klebsormidium nitens TaxID=105231 RepID=A0A0U9HK17_KLENI|nr:hypothetical protein KFL_002010100 [Klebsormidium nitens]|eukprot:GAQ84693.1 hypothetical protein KFL_002010100 [Klebsormidium nitens]
MAQKRMAVEALAPLSFVKALDLDRPLRLRLARQLVNLCRSAVEKRHVEVGETSDVRDLKVGLGGLANLASGDSVTGAFLKNERLFSILAALLNPSALLATSIFNKAAKEFLYFEDHFEHSDTGYAEWDLSETRRRVRASTTARPDRTEVPLRPLPRADLPVELQTPMTASLSSQDSLTFRMLLAWYSIRHLFGAFDPPGNAATSPLVARFPIGVWYRLLTAALRLMSSLSTEASNHEWMLKQGALQAVRKILQYLPADRMRSGHQEAALFVYRLFENRAVHRIIGESPVLTGLLREIVAELVSIDSDLFDEGWGQRMGLQLYEELFKAAEDSLLDELVTLADALSDAISDVREAVPGAHSSSASSASFALFLPRTSLRTSFQTLLRTTLQTLF